MIGIIDYDIGNLANVHNAIAALGYQSIISPDKDVLKNCDALILPGVGAFEDGIAALKNRELIAFLGDWVKKDNFLLGICLGMQLLFDKSYENGVWSGLGYLPGDIMRFETELKVPHMGWNSLIKNRDDRIIDDIQEGEYVYFVHSYYAVEKNATDVVFYTEYGIRFPAVVRRGNVIGMQFHPEKSAATGKKLLKNYLEMTI